MLISLSDTWHVAQTSYACIVPNHEFFEDFKEKSMLMLYWSFRSKVTMPNMLWTLRENLPYICFVGHETALKFVHIIFIVVTPRFYTLWNQALLRLRMLRQLPTLGVAKARDLLVDLVNVFGQECILECPRVAEVKYGHLLCALLHPPKL